MTGSAIWGIFSSRVAVLARRREVNTEPKNSYCTTPKEYKHFLTTLVGGDYLSVARARGAQMTLLRVGKEKRRVRGEKKENVTTGIRIAPQSVDLTAPPLKLEHPSKASLRF